jgi:hypothetical protein
VAVTGLRIFGLRKVAVLGELRIFGLTKVTVLCDLRIFGLGMWQ